MYSDDDEENEDEQTDQQQANPGSVDGDAEPSDEPGVKAEPRDDDETPHKRREKTPSDELHMYSVDELKLFRKKDLFADVALLEGTSFSFPAPLNVTEPNN